MELLFVALKALFSKHGRIWSLSTTVSLSALCREFQHSSVTVLQECMRVEELKCNPFAARIVALFSEDGSGELSFQKFINLFSVFSANASAETKTVWAFGLWDFDGALMAAWNHPSVQDDHAIRHLVHLLVSSSSELQLPAMQQAAARPMLAVTCRHT